LSSQKIAYHPRPDLAILFEVVNVQVQYTSNLLGASVPSGRALGRTLGAWLHVAEWEIACILDLNINNLE